MFLRKLRQTRNGQTYIYYSLVETVRAPGRSVRQRTICYLGRLDNLRPPDWLRLAERLPDPAWLPILMDEVGYSPPPPAGPVTGIWAVPDSIAWTNPRRLGDVYVALRAWQHLGLDRLLERLLGNSRSHVPMSVVAALIAINRLVDPRSERGIHHWLPSTALPELLNFPGARLTLNHLYRCLSLVEPHKSALEKHLAEQGRDLLEILDDRRADGARRFEPEGRRVVRERKMVVDGLRNRRDADAAFGFGGDAARALQHPERRQRRQALFCRHAESGRGRYRRGDGLRVSDRPRRLPAGRAAARPGCG